MMNLDGWDIALYVSAGYVAVRILIRMMAARRDGLLDRFRGQMERRREAEESRKREKQKQPWRPGRSIEDDEDQAKAA